ncbi:DUF262 domain-containing protein [Fervidibacillus albus]|uniref:DUF262 domain-containing protein n=1 Tax=Fervidibacillus albus TaxID=2980026 RepID=A0A9E8RX00_9BACI|nr:DUF262 domain-containing protein [Fervidibacillus albus]WAA08987.1 DUF262 domain-containing protein [Fervidibacillus albus]
MTLLQDELKIRKIHELFDMKLALPSYQRPYSWSVKSTNTLFYDIYNAYKEGLQEYRIGSVILHKENKKYNIVDGQQRLTTLSILLYCLGEKNLGLLQEKYSKLSNDAILTNYEILSKRINELSEDEQNKYKKYLLEHSTVVQIVTDSEQEAFQFFDSQNSRGKELKPHDLLKSYHLREMNDEEENQKIKIINQWENVNEDDLNDLFKIYLYPLTQWYKGKSGLNYSTRKIDVFKGIKTTNVFNYAIYHKASNIFVEQFNANGSNELLASRALNQFQLTQPLIAGKRFFNYTLHYKNLLEQVKKLIHKVHTNEQIPSKRTGDLYIKQLYECTLLFFVDRFGIENVSKVIMQQLYTWSYSLRLVMDAVYPQTISKYVRGKHERINHGFRLLTEISEMNDIGELKLITLEKPNVEDRNKKKYKAVYDLLCEWNRW